MMLSGGGGGPIESEKSHIGRVGPFVASCLFQTRWFREDSRLSESRWNRSRQLIYPHRNPNRPRQSVKRLMQVMLRARFFWKSLGV